MSMSIHAQPRTAMAVLGGGLVKENNKWRTTRFDEGDNFGALGDRLRVDAAYVLYNKNSSLTIIPSCGKGQYKDIPDAPTVAEVIKQELMAMGVPEAAIEKEEESGNTWQQLQELKKIIVKNGFDKMYMLSNRSHLPRVRAMIEVDGELNALLKKDMIELVSAEEVLIEHDAYKWKNDIDAAYQSEAMQKRIALEEQGVRQIKNGTYKLQ